MEEKNNLNSFPPSSFLNYNILLTEEEEKELPFIASKLKDKKLNPLSIGIGDDDVVDDNDDRFYDDVHSFDDIVRRVSIPDPSSSMMGNEDYVDYNFYFEPKSDIASISNQSEYENEKRRLENVTDEKTLQEDVGFLKLSFFPKTPDPVSSNRSGLYEWIVSYEAEWGVAMVDAYKSQAFVHSLEQKQFMYFNFGESLLMYSSGVTQPYREKSLVELSDVLVSKISLGWKPLEKSELTFILYKEKNVITQKTILRVEFISEKLRKVIPYLKCTVNIQHSADKSTITHIVTISTWLDFSNDCSGWMSRISTTVHQRNMSSSVYYGLEYFFKTLFTKTNKIFEQ